MTVIHKPILSRVTIKRVGQKIEITLPSRKFSFDCIAEALIPLLYVALPLSVFFNTGSGSPFILIMISPFVWIGLYWLSEIIFSFIGTRRVTIDECKISLSSKIVGFNYCENLNAHRLSIREIQLFLASDFNYETRESFTWKTLSIWAGSKSFDINFNLDPIEKEWLAYELANWLKLAITRN